jgi:hypothetical protein
MGSSSNVMKICLCRGTPVAGDFRIITLGLSVLLGIAIGLKLALDLRLFDKQRRSAAEVITEKITCNLTSGSESDCSAERFHPAVQTKLANNLPLP